MKIYCLNSFLLFYFCFVIEAVEQVSWDLKKADLEDSDVVYRVSRGIHGKKKDGECRYQKGPWSQCDSSNMQKKTLSLKKGDSTCEQTKVISRKCKKACKYLKGDWSDCDVATNKRMRTDSLKPKSDSSCQQTRTLSKKCKKVCKYEKQGSWSDCDSATGSKTKTLILKNGNPQMCEPSKKIIKPCNKSHGGHKGRQDDYDEDE